MIPGATFHQVEQFLLQRFQTAGVSNLVNSRRSQFLDLGEYLFAEVVLTEATRLEEVEGIVRDTAKALEPRGIVLDRVVRAEWEILDVAYVGPSRSPDGGIRAASEFHVLLKSGSRTHHVAVAVSSSAIEVVKRKVGAEQFVFQKTIAQTVHSFVQHQLSLGGTSYWSPLIAPSLEINGIAMSFVVERLAPFSEQL